MITSALDLTLEKTIGEHEILIRPIYIEDKKIEADFVKNLSTEKKHYRFMCAMKELSPQLLTKLCTVDGHETMAFIATIQDENDKEIEIGVCRYVGTDNPNIREFAITTANDWHEKGLDTLLMQQLIDYAKTRGITQLYSIDLADDPYLRDLAAKMHMETTRDPDDYQQVIHSINI